MAAGDVVIGHAGVIKIDNAAGALTDYSGDVERATGTISEVSGGGYFVANSTWQQQTSETNAPKSWSVSITAVDSEGATELGGMVRAWLMGTRNHRTVELYQPDESAGSHKMSGEAKLVNPGSFVDITAGSGNPVRKSIQLAGHSTCTYAVVT